MDGRRSRTLGSDVPSIPDPGEHAHDDSETDGVEIALDSPDITKNSKSKVFKFANF